MPASTPTPQPERNSTTDSHLQNFADQSIDKSDFAPVFFAIDGSGEFTTMDEHEP